MLLLVVEDEDADEDVEDRQEAQEAAEGVQHHSRSMLASDNTPIGTERDAN